MNETKKDSNKGYLYPNSNKTKPTQPDFTGKATIENKEWRLAAWENKTPEGKKYLSITVSPPLENASQSNVTNNNYQNKKPDSHQQNHQSDISKEELDDLDAILKLTDDDNPFN